MKKLEMREVLVVRCDVCGSECNSYVAFNVGTPEEKHACSDWDEALQMRCEDKLRNELAKASHGVKELPHGS